MKILVTGGAGFIGSHLAEYHVKNHEVVIFDNFISGKKEFIQNNNIQIIKSDILDKNKLEKAMKEIDICYHLAADPDVKESFNSPLKNFIVNLKGSFNVLEACRKNDVSKLIFTSSSVVYGNAEMPTPETATIKPISNYGAAKASFENYLMSYSNLYNLDCLVLRYANIIGPRLTHGIIYDFYNKLKRNQKKLEILGNGEQEKSYLNVKDCVEATIFATENMEENFEIYNIGSEETISVNQIANIIVKEMNLRDVQYIYTGGKEGWPGDIPKMLLSIEKIKSKGWNPKYSIVKSIKDTLKYLNEFC
jgi:UDP-glucose 4-epimerase